MKRELGDGYELDDDSARIDREAVHAYLGGVSYWAKGRSRDVQDALIDDSARVVGLYHEGAQVGFSRTLCDGHAQSYLADVYVLEEHRAARARRRKFGFTEPSERVLERPGG